MLNAGGSLDSQSNVVCTLCGVFVLQFDVHCLQATVRQLQTMQQHSSTVDTLLFLLASPTVVNQQYARIG